MFLKNHPAMKIKDSLVIADLHIGITKDIYDQGIFMPKQSEKMAERINKLKRITKAKRLVLLGDVKHKVPGFSLHEKYELEKFFGALDFKNITIVKGNHDGGIEKMLPVEAIEKVSVKKSMVVGDCFLTHGHRRADTSKKRIVIGHNQPHIKIRDELGAYYVEPVWLRGRLRGKLKGKQLIVMPAFNELCGATIVNRDKLLGPIAKQLDKKKTKVYLIDGTDIGFLSDFISRSSKITHSRKRQR